MSENPYVPPRTPLKEDFQRPPQIVLASRFKRLIARIVDALLEGLFFLVFVWFVPGARDTYRRGIEESLPEMEDIEFEFWQEFVIPSFSIESIAFWVLTILITFVCQAYLLARYGQTIGKRMLKVKIVNEHTYRKPTLTRSFFVRECGIYLIQWLPLLPLLNVLWIFGSPRKCLHDLWSRTIVIDAIE